MLGDRPSHPELLDWLAREFMKSGWSVKHLHRLIMKSSLYRMGSRHPDAAKAKAADPENRLWWRHDIRRLEAEQIRDGILAVTGLLDDTMGGKTIPLRNRQFVFNHTSRDHTAYAKRRRRSVYLPVVRNHLCDIFQQFDYPDPATPTGNRHTTVVAPQALLMMNSPLVMDAADALAGELLKAKELKTGQRVSMAYEQVLARQPTAKERARAVRFIEAAPESPQQIWSLLCQSLLAANEFIYLN